jgi:hypothetical protein
MIIGMSSGFVLLVMRAASSSCTRHGAKEPSAWCANSNWADSRTYQQLAQKGIRMLLGSELSLSDDLATASSLPMARFTSAHSLCPAIADRLCRSCASCVHGLPMAQEEKTVISLSEKPAEILRQLAWLWC